VPFSLVRLDSARNTTLAPCVQLRVIYVFNYDRDILVEPCFCLEIASSQLLHVFDLAEELMIPLVMHFMALLAFGFDWFPFTVH
jgi:hypothetical protein